MKELLLNGYECITAILPFLAGFAVLSSIYRRRKVYHRRKYFLMLFIFAVYISAVFHFTGAGTIFDLHRYGLQLNNNEINIIPFSNTIDITAYFLNILLFVPFGFLLPFIWSDKARVLHTVIYGSCFSLLIELSQLLNNRRTDIDDLLMNTLGTLVGYLLLKIFCSITKRTVNNEIHLRYEPVIYILIMFAGRFLLFNEFGMAKVIYGF